MKKMTAILLLFGLPFSSLPGISFAAPVELDFEKIKQTANSKAEKGLGFAEDRTYDYEVKGPTQGLPDSAQFLGNPPLSQAQAPNNILLSTAVGERIISFYESFNPISKNTSANLISDNAVWLLKVQETIRSVGEALEGAYAISLEDDFQKVLGLIYPIAMDKGVRANVWNQPLRILQDHGDNLSDIVHDFIEALVWDKDQTDIDFTLKFYQDRIASEFVTPDQKHILWGEALKDSLGKGSNLNDEVDALVGLLTSGLANAQSILSAQLTQIVEDRTIDYEVKGPNNILLSTTIGERVVKSITDNQQQIISRPVYQISFNFEEIFLKIEQDFHDAFFGNTDPTHTAKLINTLADAMKPGTSNIVFHEFGHSFNEYVRKTREVLTAYLDALLVARNPAEVEKAAQTAQDALAPLAAIGEGAADVLAAKLNEQLGKGLYSPKVTELVGILKDGFAAMQQVVTKGVDEIKEAAKLGPCNDHSFVCLPEVDDEVVVGVKTASPGDVLEFFARNRAAFLSALGEGASDALGVFSEDVQEIRNTDIQKILIGMNKILRDADPTRATAETRKLGVYIDDIIIGLRKSMSQFTLELSKATTAEEVASASQNAHAALETILKQFHSDLETFKSVIPTWWGVQTLNELVPHTIDLWESVLEIGAVTRQTINQVAGHTLLKQLESEVHSFFDIWFELEVKIGNQYPDETAEVNAGLHSAMDAYKKAIFSSFMDYAEDLLISDNAADRAAAEKSAQSKFLLAQAELTKETEELYGGLLSKVDAKTQALLSASLTDINSAIVQLGGAVARWPSIFSTAWTSCMYPMCGGL